MQCNQFSLCRHFCTLQFQLHYSLQPLASTEWIAGFSEGPLASACESGKTIEHLLLFEEKRNEQILELLPPFRDTDAGFTDEWAVPNTKTPLWDNLCLQFSVKQICTKSLAHVKLVKQFTVGGEITAEGETYHPNTVALLNHVFMGKTLENAAFMTLEVLVMRSHQKQTWKCKAVRQPN